MDNKIIQTRRTYWLKINLGHIYDKLKTNLGKSLGNHKIFRKSGLLLLMTSYQWMTEIICFYQHNDYCFYTRQHIVLSTYYLRQFYQSICPSVTFWHCTQMNENRIMQFSLRGSKNTLVFWHQQWLGRLPLPPKICGQNDPSLWKVQTLTFNQYLLISTHL